MAGKVPNREEGNLEIQLWMASRVDEDTCLKRPWQELSDVYVRHIHLADIFPPGFCSHGNMVWFFCQVVTSSVFIQKQDRRVSHVIITFVPIIYLLCDPCNTMGVENVQKQPSPSKQSSQPGMVVYTWNPSTWEGEARGSRVSRPAWAMWAITSKQTKTLYNLVSSGNRFPLKVASPLNIT